MKTAIPLHLVPLDDETQFLELVTCEHTMQQALEDMHTLLDAHPMPAVIRKRLHRQLYHISMHLQQEKDRLKSDLVGQANR